MAFKYACFISYRHAEGKLINTMLDELCEALTDELEAYFGRDSIYRDKDRLKAGEFFPEKIRSALYSSVCMIAAYTPTYFDNQHTYCAWEFKSMEKLEKQRLERLKPEDKGNGLIIPVVLRGSRYLPRVIKDRRQYYNFENFLLSGKKINKHPHYAPAIKKIAEYIADLWNKFAKMGDSLFENKENLKLPEKKDIIDWFNVKGITQHWIPFPNRQESIT